MKPVLPVNYQDDILNEAMNGKRKYLLIPNADGTYCLEDATTYDQTGSNFGAGDINATNEAVNQCVDEGKIIADIDALGALEVQGYIPDALLLKQTNDSLKTYYDEETDTLYIQGGTSSCSYDSSTETLYIG